MAEHHNTSDVTIVEINPVVYEAARSHFASWNGEVLDMDHVSVIIDDGAAILRKMEEHYDAIVIDIEEATVIQSSPLYTVDYFRIAKSKLHD